MFSENDLNGEAGMLDDDTSRRAETGVMQFGNDWPGIFIRGDNAFFYAMQLERYLEVTKSTKNVDFIAQAVVRGLVETLKGCDVRLKLKPQKAELC